MVFKLFNTLLRTYLTSLQLVTGTGSVVDDFLFIVTPIVGVCNCSMFCCTLLYVHFSIAIILIGKRELIALLNLSSWCLVMVERLFLAMPRGCLQFVIVVFPDHTHLLFLLPKDTLDFTTAGDWDCVATVERLPALHYSVDFIFLSFGIMSFIVEL